MKTYIFAKYILTINDNNSFDLKKVDCLTGSKNGHYYNVIKSGKKYNEVAHAISLNVIKEYAEYSEDRHEFSLQKSRLIKKGFLDTLKARECALEKQKQFLIEKGLFKK